MPKLIERISVLDDTIKKKINTQLHCNNNHVVADFEKVERLCRDRGEIYGYARLVEREDLNKDVYKIVSGRIRHLEKCNGLT